MTNDIRNKQITLKVRENECTLDAVKRYLKRKGFTHFIKTTFGYLQHDMFSNDEYYELWIGRSSYNEETQKATVTFNGNR